MVLLYVISNNLLTNNFKDTGFKNIFVWQIKVGSFIKLVSEQNKLSKTQFLGNCYDYSIVSSMFHAMKFCTNAKITYSYFTVQG